MDLVASIEHLAASKFQSPVPITKVALDSILEEASSLLFVLLRSRYPLIRARVSAVISHGKVVL